ncbi:hypothetical protein FA15DRAFT_656472 [Coprinopsis marcescibilis]|uniref:TPR-like protein n=1 Tax=Coprinopsis marcescibilis TaxID=230819 RepID=A0A5C3L686_COPMA|nr:hypothetical protein FA15DRAFT_656472 [Coprinopsis marcescibilis]
MATPQTSSTAQTAAQSLKEMGNERYQSKEYQQALNIYSRIIYDYGANTDVPRHLLAVVRSNRAACYLKLRSFLEAFQDCAQVLEHAELRPERDHALFLKMVHRAARSKYGVSDLEAADRYWEQYRALGETDPIGETPVPAEPKLKQKQPSAPPPPSSPALRSINYRIQVFTDEAAKLPDKGQFVYNEQMPADMFGTNRTPGKAETLFLDSLVRKHDAEVRGKRRWRCWNCNKKATSMTHTPATYMGENPPLILDYCLPVCQVRRRCDKEARKMITHDLSMAQSLTPRRR